MRYLLYEEPNDICMTFTYLEDGSGIEVLCEIPAKTGFETARYLYPEDRVYDVNMTLDSVVKFQTALTKSIHMLETAWKSCEHGQDTLGR